MKGSSRQDRTVTWLFISAGLILMLAGAVSLLPTVSASGPTPMPADFGEEAPSLRPTVTPLPLPRQVTPAPLLLPDESTAALAETAEPKRSAVQPAGRPTLRADEAGRSPQRLIIPAIKLDAPVELVGWHTVNGASQWDVPDHFAAGWLKTSALLGKPGNTVLTGHHNIAGEVFRHLVKLKPGDEIEMRGDGQSYFYQVVTHRIVLEQGQPLNVRLENATWMQSTDDERLTLITCWPYTSNSHRLIIVAKPQRSERPVKSDLQ